MRTAARVDDNQSEIVAVFRKLGASVHCTHQLGDGFPDIVVGFRRKNYLIEIKDGLKSPSKQRLTTDEEIFHRNWRGNVKIIRSVDEAIKFINEIK